MINSAMWKDLSRLIFNRASLIKVLTEIKLRRLRRELFQGVKLRRVLVAGGTRRADGRVGGTESVLLEDIDKSVDIVVVNINKATCPDVVADLTCSWPFRRSVFDMTVSTWVVEHLKEPLFFFNEAHRVLTESGILIITVPFIHRKHGSPSDYLRFTDMALIYLARNAGFRHVKVWKVGGTPLLCVVALLWPFFRIPVIGAFMTLVAGLVDYFLLAIARMLNKGTESLESYPISYILYARKEEV